MQVTTEAQLGLIGGTMGLLTGFSLLSGVEIIYYVVRFFLSLRISRALAGRLWALRACLITSFTPFGRSGRVTHAAVQ